MMDIQIWPNERGYPANKLADVELHFTDGDLAGMKLIGLSIWKGTTPQVSMPTREYMADGQRRYFPQLRPITDARAQHDLVDRILAAWDSYVQKKAWGDA